MNLPALSITEQHWLYAHSYRIDTLAGIVVYRSTALRATDPMYLPVANALLEHTPRLIVQQVIKDQDMMFGHGELAVYRLKDSFAPIPGLFAKVLESTTKGGLI